MASANLSPPGIIPVPAPWTLKGTIYTFATYISSSSARALSEDKSFIYAPLEKDSSFADGKPVGGLGMVQVIRYTESPVGPYDELVMVPGAFEREDVVATKGGTSQIGGEKKVKKSNLRCTRIYVSQEKTCWNGRKNWNIPKHLASFTFVSLPNNAISISIRPHITSSATGMESPAASNSKPFFQATFKMIPYIPSIPLSTGIARYLGLDLALVQPALPSGRGEVVGTEGEGWRKVNALEWAKKSSLGWWDLRQHENQGSESQPLLSGESGSEISDEKGFQNWWPGVGRWHLGVVMEDATVEFPEGECWL